MSTVETNQLRDVATSLQEWANEAIRKASAEEFERFEKGLNDFEAACREVQQDLWADQAQAAIQRLRDGDPLGDADREVIRAFLVSDAEYYLKLENDFDNWIAELHRLLGDIASRIGNLNRDSVAELRGVLKDAIRLVPDIRNYLEERERVNRCKAAMEDLDSDSRKLLARILEQDLEDPNR
jgi:hypothetical protein